MVQKHQIINRQSNMKKKSLRILFVISSFLLISLLLVNCESTAGSGHVRLFFSGNNLGHLGPCGCDIPAGGLARRVGFLLDNRRKQDLLIETGNWVTGHPDILIDLEQQMDRARLLAESMHLLDYDVVGLGRHDLDLGLSFIKKIRRKFKLPIISTNLVDENKKPVFKTNKLLRKEGLTLGILSVCTLGSPPENLTWSDPMAAIRNTLPIIVEKSDYIILLCDLPVEMIAEVAADFPEIIFLLRSSPDISYTDIQKHEHLYHASMDFEGQSLGILEFDRPEESQGSVTNITYLENQIRRKTGTIEQHKLNATGFSLTKYYQDEPEILQLIHLYESEIEDIKVQIQTATRTMLWEKFRLTDDIPEDPDWSEYVERLESPQ